MSADYSRVRFDPLRDYSGVGMQQGRVWLDADFNEQVAITDRRLRAEVADLAPERATVSRLTPNAFAITASDGKLSIGAGRMYVDGLLAENHGSTLDFDPVLAEPNGKEAIAYAAQPYGPLPEHWPPTGWPPPEIPDLPTSPGPHLVYLDVSVREKTYLNEPDLVEPALGVDTTTRTQVVWQVRVLPDVDANTTRSSPIGAWDTLVAPSPLRLTTTTVEMPPVSDPCEVAPGGGYRGPENHLYRVQLYSATQFTWSRDNASVASAVVQVLSTKRLRLASLGRDDVLAIRSNDWVEVTDDRRELAHVSGFMARVTVEEGTVVSLSDELPADLINSAVHLRVRKWDSPLIDIPTDGTPVPLELGGAVAFSSAGEGLARPGDHWVFAARVDTSVEKLVAAPPRGIHHHYARLALVTAPDHALDLRPDWPTAAGESCGCHICVTPESHASGELTLQAALARLKKARGGTLALCPGTYELTAPLDLRGLGSVRIRGAGRRTQLVARGTAIAVTLCEDVVLQDFAVRGGGQGATIVLGEANRVCRLEGLWVDQPVQTAIGLSGAQLSVTVRGCTITSAIGVAASRPGLLSSDLSIQDNRFVCTSRCIDFGIDHGGAIVHTGRTVIAGNTVTGCADAAIVVTGLVPQDVTGADGTLQVHHNMLEVTGSGIVTGGRARIAGNTVVASGRLADRHGIMLEPSPPDTPQGTAQVAANTVSGFGGYGLVAPAQLGELTVVQNTIRGTAGGILVQPEVDGGHATVAGNHVLQLRPVGPTSPQRTDRPEASSDPGFGRATPTTRPTTSPTIAARPSTSPTITSRPSTSPTFTSRPSTSPTITSRPTTSPTFTSRPGTAETAPVASRPGGGLDPFFASALGKAATTFGASSQLMGIAIIGVATVTVVDNTVDGIAAEAQDAAQTRPMYGIVVDSCVTASIAGNTVARIGHPSNAIAEAYGIRCGGWQDTISVSGNTVLSGSPLRAGWNAVALLNVPAARLTSIRSVETAGGMFTFAGQATYIQRQASGHVEINGNTVEGGRSDVAVSINTKGDVTMHANRCQRPGGGDLAAIRLVAAAAVVQGNRVSGGKPSMTITVASSAAVVLGNLTTGGIQLGGTMVEVANKPVAELNTMA